MRRPAHSPAMTSTTQAQKTPWLKRPRPDAGHPCDSLRRLDSSTGTFHTDFQARAQPFADLVRKVQTTTVGTVTEAGLVSVDRDGAQVFVAVQVKTSIGEAPDPQAEGWRMRIDVQKVGDEAKVSNVEYIP